MTKKLLLILLTITLSLATNANAETFYVTATGGGTDITAAHTGCATAYRSELFTTAENANWGAGAEKVSAGDTVYLCSNGGTYATTLVIPATGLGSAGQPITIRNAPGQTPVVLATTGNGMSRTTGGAFLTVDGITFAGWADGSSGLLFLEPAGDIIVKNCTFSKSNAATVTFALQITTINTLPSVSNVEIDHNIFSLNLNTEAIRFTISNTTADSIIHDVNIHSNTFGDIKYAARMYLNPAAYTWILAGGRRPYNIKFNDNVITKTDGSAFKPEAGMTVANGGVSEVKRNWITDCGSDTRDATNCLQMHYTNATEITDNYIGDITSHSCDGVGIILDRTVGSDAYLSTDNLVARNTIIGINSTVCTGAGIQVYRGTGNIVENNVIDGQGRGRGLQLDGAISSNNLFYNNTVVNVVDCFSLNDYANNVGAAASIWTNNICSTASIHGFRVVDNSTAPTESYNVIYNVPSNDVTLSGTDQTANPLFLAAGDYRLHFDSPARGSGTALDLPYDLLRRPIPATAPDIGAYQSNYVNMPWGVTYAP